MSFEKATCITGILANGELALDTAVLSICIFMALISYLECHKDVHLIIKMQVLASFDTFKKCWNGISIYWYFAVLTAWKENIYVHVP